MIPCDSKSYPYLAIAQNLNFDYGEVLTTAEFLEGNLSAVEYWTELHHSNSLFHFVALAVKAEQRRRLQESNK
jgi:hypothetical protein